MADIDTTQYTGWRWAGAVIRKWWWWYASWAVVTGTYLWWTLR